MPLAPAKNHWEFRMCSSMPEEDRIPIIVNETDFISFSSMDRVLADSGLLGTVRQANPKGNDLKHCLDAACKTSLCAGGGVACEKEQHIRLNPWGVVTNKMQCSNCKLARKIVISVLQGTKNAHLRFRLVSSTRHE